MELKPLYIGTDKIYKITFLKDGTPFDISGSTIYFTIKSNVDDTVELISKSVSTHTSTNTTEIKIVHSDTINFQAGIYVYDFICQDSFGNITLITSGELPIISKVKNG